MVLSFEEDHGLVFQFRTTVIGPANCPSLRTFIRKRPSLCDPGRRGYSAASNRAGERSERRSLLSLLRLSPRGQSVDHRVGNGIESPPQKGGAMNRQDVAKTFAVAAIAVPVLWVGASLTASTNSRHPTKPRSGRAPRSTRLRDGTGAQGHMRSHGPRRDRTTGSDHAG